MSAFCGSCGAPANPAARFCTSCGATTTPAAQQPAYEQPAYHQPVPHQPVPHQPVPHQPGPPPTGGGSRRKMLIAGGAVAGVAALVGGIFAGMALFGGDDDKGDSTAQQRHAVVEAVTSEPSEAWTYQAPDDTWPSVSAAGDIIMVSSGGDGDAQVARLAEDGEEMWRSTEAAGTSAIDTGSNLVYGFLYYDGGGFVALDADTGEEVWRDDDSYVSLLGDGLVLTWQYDDEGYNRRSEVRDADGNELWSRETGELMVEGDGLYGVEGDTVYRIDVRSGETAWEVDTEIEAEGDAENLSLAVNQGIVAVSGWDEVMGLDPESGDELWREGDMWDHDYVSPFGTTMVSMTRSGDEENWEEGEVIIFDAEGEVQRKVLDPDEYRFYSSPFVIDGTTYIDDTEGMIYDEALKPIASYDGTITPAGNGFYQVLNGELSYHDLEDGEQWARQIGDSDDSLSITAAPGLVLVSGDNTVTAYK